VSAIACKNLILRVLNLGRILAEIRSDKMICVNLAPRRTVRKGLEAAGRTIVAAKVGPR
jgi:hypothetical protein